MLLKILDIAFYTINAGLTKIKSLGRTLLKEK